MIAMETAIRNSFRALVKQYSVDNPLLVQRDVLLSQTTKNIEVVPPAFCGKRGDVVIVNDATIRKNFASTAGALGNVDQIQLLEQMIQSAENMVQQSIGEGNSFILSSKTRNRIPSSFLSLFFVFGKY